MFNLRLYMFGIKEVIILLVLVIIDRVEHWIGGQTNYLEPSLICCLRIYIYVLTHMPVSLYVTCNRLYRVLKLLETDEVPLRKLD